MSSARRPVTVGIVGAGHIGRRYVDAIRGHGGDACRIVAIADIDRERATSLAGGADVAIDARDLLHRQVPDLMVVATPPSQHVEDILACLEHGVHVLCEKPLVVNTSDLRRLAAHQVPPRPMLWMASKYRHAAAVRWAHRLVCDGSVGAIEQVDIAFAHPSDMADRWHCNVAISGGGVLMDNGPHALDLLRLFLGPLTGITATEQASTGRLAVEDTVSLSVRNAQGHEGHAFLSWATHAEDQYFLKIQGSTGRIRIGWNDSVHVRAEHPDRLITGPRFDGMAALRDQFLHTVHAVALGQVQAASRDDAFANVEAIQCAYQAIQTGQWQSIEETSSAGVVAMSQATG